MYQVKNEGNIQQIHQEWYLLGQQVILLSREATKKNKIMPWRREETDE